MRQPFRKLCAAMIAIGASIATLQAPAAMPVASLTEAATPPLVQKAGHMGWHHGWRHHRWHAGWRHFGWRHHRWGHPWHAGWHPGWRHGWHHGWR